MKCSRPTKNIFGRRRVRQTLNKAWLTPMALHVRIPMSLRRRNQFAKFLSQISVFTYRSNLVRLITVTSPSKSYKNLALEPRNLFKKSLMNTPLHRSCPLLQSLSRTKCPPSKRTRLPKVLRRFSTLKQLQHCMKNYPKKAFKLSIERQESKSCSETLYGNQNFASSAAS